VLGFQALFAKGSTDGMGHLGGAAILVYCSAWGVLGWRNYQLVLGSSHVFKDPPDIVAPPGGSRVDPGASLAALPQQASTSGTHLPALGGGSYPPIDKK